MNRKKMFETEAGKWIKKVLPGVGFLSFLFLLIVLAENF